MQRNLLLALALTLTTTLAASLTPRDDAASLIPRDFVHYPPFACEPNRCEVCHENCQASRIKHGYTRDWLVHTCYDKTCVNSGDCLGCCNQNKEPCPWVGGWCRIPGVCCTDSGGCPPFPPKALA
ncbi:unnamed protein product [Zymoseptoria tritici ST99CH_1A5]|uniref:4Fe-4S ferredoxin-type domain-containing protein n=1 Tax=Zymoseptoria tritici ST99CH_1A5 TaxID=1276529 RepID=A0A1Y6LFS1_ZYMTR|nr:unnamed protein product [Zymoseptoria tritici ST99CH_3D1]SMY22479.1 unnamed protein product [Zymoseptoria tritici ST99CH_1A5]